MVDTWVAIKDINIGDELTCNYLLYDYECDGHQFDCNCGCSNCYKHIKGFKNLSLEEKVKILHLVDINVLEQFKEDNPNIIIIDNNKLPNSLIIDDKIDNIALKSKQEFKINDEVFENDIMHINHNNIIIMKLNNKYELINNIKQTVNKIDYREFYYFDSYMNHSCDPNTKQIYISDNKYKMICIKDIYQGDELTCDYGIFDINNDDVFK